MSEDKKPTINELRTLTNTLTDYEVSITNFKTATNHFRSKLNERHQQTQNIQMEEALRGLNKLDFELKQVSSQLVALRPFFAPPPQNYVLEFERRIAKLASVRDVFIREFCSLGETDGRMDATTSREPEEQQ